MLTLKFDCHCYLFTVFVRIVRFNCFCGILKMYEKVNFHAIRTYLTENKFPEDVKEKGKKANFKRQCKKFSIVDNKLMYNKSDVGKVSKTYFIILLSTYTFL